MLLLVNTILHAFRWAIVFGFESYDKEQDDGVIMEVFPARVKFRGFSDKAIFKSYKKIAEYISDNYEELLKESREG